MKAELVKTITDDDVILSGLLVEGEERNPAIIFIHGFETDFFTHKFISSIGEKCEQSGITFLAVQHRGTGMRMEFIKTNGSGTTIGSYYEKLEEAYLDIDAWVQFLHSLGYDNIILSGHSLGTLKIMRYMNEGKHKNLIGKLILLSPFDKNWLLKHAANQIGRDLVELVAYAEEQVLNGNADEIAPTGYDDVPHTYANFLSWAVQDDFGRMFDFSEKDYSFSYLKRIKVPVHIVVGTRDEFFHPSNSEHPEEAMQILLQHIPHSSGQLIKGAKHVFRGYESNVAEEMVNFSLK